MMRRGVAKLSAIAIACTISLAAQAVAEAQAKLDVPAGELISALKSLATQLDIELVYQPEQLRKIRTDGVQGTYSPQQAIAILLKGTPLTVHTDTSGAMVIAPSAVPKTSTSISPQERGPEGDGSPFAGEERKSFWSRFRLAQSDSPSASRVDAQRPSASKGEGQDEERRQAPAQRAIELEEIVVTGTHIQDGAAPAGSKVTVIDRAMIERSGRGRIQDVLATLSQNFGVMNENNSNEASNRSRGSEVQLRGLGIGTTLTLVDGQRQASGGGRGAYVNIASIPASAIERVEVLPEGASAIYGSDAIGGVVNVILRKDYSGFETRARASSAGGEAQETQFAQLFGTTWSRGHVLVGYDFYEREQLGAAARPYSATNDDLRPFGGSDFRSVGGNPGTILDDSFEPTHAIPSGQDGSDLTDADRIPGLNYSDDVTFGTILPWTRMHSVFVNSSVEITDDWEMFAQGRYSTRDMEVLSGGRIQTLFEIVPETNAFNRFGRPVNIAYDLTEDLGPQHQTGATDTWFATAGITGKLSQSWKLKMAAAYGEEKDRYRTDNGLCFFSTGPYLASSDPEVALNLFGDGSHTNPATLDALRCSGDALARSTTSSFNAIANGPVFDWPAGSVKLAVGADYREEHYRARAYEEAFDQLTSRDIKRNVSAVFAEMSIPVIGPGNAAERNRLEISLAGRHESYSDFGSTFNPKIGVSWRPSAAATLRGTWGTSFRAPPFYLSDPQFGANFASSSFVRDPLSTAPDGRSQVLVLSGNNPNVQEETAEVWTAGIDLAVPSVRGMTLSFTWFDVDYQDKISRPGETSSLLIQEDRWREAVTRNPSQAQVDAICDTPFFQGPCTGPIAAILDVRTLNLAGLAVRGLDAGLSYSLPSHLGNWDLNINGTYTFDHKTQVTETSPAFEAVDTLGNPLALRFSASVAWSMRAWTAALTANHAGAYADPGQLPQRRIGSWTTLDLNVGYRFEPGHGWLGDTRLLLGASNLFDKAPPFVDQDNVYGYDQANATLLGRQVSAMIVKAW